MYRIIVPLLIAFIAPWLSARADSVPPKPSLHLFLERTAIREDDMVRGELWLANEGDIPITATAHYTAPGFLGLLDSASSPAASIALGTIAPHGVARRAFRLRSDRDIMVGAFQLSFTVEFGWDEGTLRGRSFVSAEKTVTMNLLGTDSIAGVPLALAGLVVPGLLFWVVLGWFKVPWAKTGLGEITLYSIPISLLFMVVGRWAPAMDLGSGIGVLKLGYLALGGALLGAIVGLADYRRRRANQEAEDALVIADSDDMPELIGKLAARHRYAGPKRMRVTLKSGAQYEGSWVVRDGGYTYLFGAFYINSAVVASELADELDALRQDDALTDHHERLMGLLGVVKRGVEKGVESAKLFCVVELAKPLAAADTGELGKDVGVEGARHHFRWADADAPDASPMEGTVYPLVQVGEPE